MEVFVARQPIFNYQEEVFGYELLYRNNIENVFPKVDGDQATADVIINSFLNIGIDELSNGKPCFINFTERLLKLKLPTCFHPREIVVEILESVQPSEELVEICKELKELNYQIALDDRMIQQENPYLYQLIPYVDYLKIDFLKENREELEEIGRNLGLKLVAVKVESRASYEEARRNGYTYFQGYFFARPTMVRSHDVPACFLSNYNTIYDFLREGKNIEDIIDLIEQNVSLSFKLLKLINSSEQKQKIHSIREAVVFLGLTEIKKWIYVLSIREKACKQTEIGKEIVQLCLTRAKMCELIGKISDKFHTDSGCFLTGMFSLMDVILGLPMSQIVRELPFQDEILDCFNGIQNNLKDILDLVEAVESAQWTVISIKCQTLNISEKELFRIYAESLSWSQSLVSEENKVLI